MEAPVAVRSQSPPEQVIAQSAPQVTTQLPFEQLIVLLSPSFSVHVDDEQPTVVCGPAVNEQVADEQEMSPPEPIVPLQVDDEHWMSTSFCPVRSQDCALEHCNVQLLSQRWVHESAEEQEHTSRFCVSVVHWQAPVPHSEATGVEHAVTRITARRTRKRINWIHFCRPEATTRA